MYADVIVDISKGKLDRSFQYLVPPKLEKTLMEGMVVEVSFGNGGRVVDAYVIGLTEKAACPPEKLKPIRRIKTTPETFEAKSVALAAWMRRQYGSTMLQALKTVLPIRDKMSAKAQRILTLAISEEACVPILAALKKKNQKGRLRLMEALLAHGSLSYTRAVKEFGASAAVCRYLEEQGWIRIGTEEMMRNPVKLNEPLEPLPPLTPAQREAVAEIREEWAGGGRPCLLHGVTGSGKTRVYLELIGEILKKGQQAILLIPEISLTRQTVSRFVRAFGEQVSIVNSRLSAGERYDQFRRARSGEVRVMIGPRSALFTPFSHLGLIIIDEEHEDTYKSETSPRYHAGETAICRARMEGAQVVFGSATPSMTSYYLAENKTYRLVKLTGRFRGRSLPSVERIDLREELRAGNRSILSRRLQEAIEQRLEKKEQVMLFLNRRGYAGFISCRSCGHVVKCPHCDVSLSQHRFGRLVCHYCGYEAPAVESCPECGSPYIGGFRAGTQQIEDIVKKRFPGARVLRMDADTTKTKEGHARLLQEFEQHGDILIGTQMIVKGHDFPRVTLVGVLAADLSLNMENYRSAERTFQLLTQAVGRSGRGERPGEALIQTYQPEHYAIQAAAAQDYESFYRQELAYRTLPGYPPAAHLLAVLASSKDEALLGTAMEYLKKYIRRVCPGNELSLIGPAEPGIGKINDVYRKVLYLKQKEYAILVYVKDKLEQYIEINSGFREIQIQFDFN